MSKKKLSAQYASDVPRLMALLSSMLFVILAITDAAFGDECVASRYLGPGVVESIKADDGSVQAEALAERLEQFRGARGEKQRQREQACLARFLGDILVSPDGCRPITDKAIKAALLAAGTLARIESWSTGNDRQTATDSDRLYTVLECLDEQPELLKTSPNLRDLRRLLEAAHARAKGGILDTVSEFSARNRSALFAAESKAGAERTKIICKFLQEREALAADYSKLHRSRYSISAALARASNAVSAAQFGQCEDVRWFENAIEAVEKLFDEKQFSQSLEGWRYINDAEYYLAILYALSGSGKKFEEIKGRLLSSDGLLKMGDGYIHPVAVYLIEKEAERSLRDAPYSDQVFISSFVPGETLLLEVPRVVAERDSSSGVLVQKYYSTPQLAKGFEKLGDIDQFSCSESLPSCGEKIARLSSHLRDNVRWNDVRVILGSHYRSAEAAEQIVTLCEIAELRAAPDEKCLLESKKVNEFWRIATVELAEDEARNIAAKLKKERRDYFLSRPRVLDNL